jgi:hypothetical protein
MGLMFWKKPKMAGAPIRISVPHKETKLPEGLRIVAKEKKTKFPGYDTMNDATRRVLLEEVGADPSLALLPWEALPEDVREKLLKLQDFERYVQIGAYAVPVVPIADAAIVETLHHVGTLQTSDEMLNNTFGPQNIPGVWVFMLDEEPIALKQSAPGVFSIEGYNLSAFHRMEAVFPGMTKME